MSSRKAKAKPLPRAATERRPFLTGFVDVILDDGQIAVMTAPVCSLESQRFADLALGMIPKSSWVAFHLNDGVHVAPKQKAFLNALMKVWPRSEELDSEIERIAMDLLHEFIELLTTRAPGAITQAFQNAGIEFGPVPK